MADGRVGTGLSDIVVALYANSGATVSYTGFQKLARAVAVSFSPETTDSNNFYADNLVAETAGAMFNGGEATFTVDGLLETASKMVFGLPAPEQVGGVDVYNYGDSANPPFVGVGFIVRYMSAGVESFVPVVLTKARFNLPTEDANTMEDTIDWQTQELTAQVYKDDSANHNWKRVGTAQATQAAAYAVLQSLLA